MTQRSVHKCVSHSKKRTGAGFDDVLGCDLSAAVGNRELDGYRTAGRHTHAHHNGGTGDNAVGGDDGNGTRGR